LPENNPEVNRLRSALAKKAEMDIIGYTYHDEQSFETMKNAINKGKSLPGGILETGMELGMGIKMAKGLGGTISQIVDPLVDGNVKQNCIVCGKQVEKDSKFCRHCGAVQEILCPGCGKVYKEMIKFCSECGSSLEAKEEPSNENA